MTLNPDYTGKLVYYDSLYTDNAKDHLNWIPGIIVGATDNNSWHIKWLYGTSDNSEWTFEQAERGFYSMYGRAPPYALY